MRKLIVVAGLMLLWTQTVKAQQCTGQYANDPTYAMLIPKDYAAQGNVAATITQTTDDSSSVPSHKITVAVDTTRRIPGPFINWQMTAYNGASISITADNPSRTIYQGSISGSPWAQTWSHQWQMGVGDIGKIYHTILTIADQYNNTTQDEITLTVVAGNGTSGLVKQDSLETNFYWQVVTTGGGSSMLTSCQECQAGTTQHCINATHTPYSTIQLTNDMSGESQLIQGVQSGNVARSNESLSFSASLAISVLPGDTGTISIDHKIICSMDGVIFEQTLPKPKTSPSGGSWNPSMTAELAFTKMALKVPTHCTPKLDASGKTIGLICDVAYYCSARSSPPDYQPTKLVTYYYTDPASVPTYWMTMSPGTALVFGKNQPGEIAIWYFPVSTVQQVLTGMGLPDPLLLDIFSLAWVSDSSTQDCTKWISGITPWYMPKW